MKFLLASLLLLLCAGCGYSNPYTSSSSESAGLATNSPSPSPSPSPTPKPVIAACSRTPEGKVTTLADGLQSQDIKVGTGTAARTGQSASVHYIGALQSNGQVFDASSSHGNTPFTFTIGKGQVIKGWDEGVPGMKVGGCRRLVIPPSLGYGAQGQPPTIPANATLVFQIELLNVGTPTPAPSASP